MMICLPSVEKSYPITVLWLYEQECSIEVGLNADGDNKYCYVMACLFEAFDLAVYCKLKSVVESRTNLTGDLVLIIHYQLKYHR